MTKLLPEPVPAEVARSQAEALAGQVDSGATPQSLEAAADRLVDTIRAIDLSDTDPYTVKYLLAGALDVTAAVSSEPRSHLVSLAVALEMVRQALDRYVEAAVVADDRPLSTIVQWLLDTTHISGRELADLLDVAPATVRRWLEVRPAGAETEEMARARVLARVVAQLRHALTSRGVVTWLESEHPLLKAPPKELLGQPAQLLSLASQGRSQNAS